MQREHRLLLFAFHRYEPHVRPGHRFANGLRISGIVLVRLHVRLHKLGRHQFHRVAQLHQTACPRMGAAAGFHPHQTAGPLRKEIHHLTPPQLPSQYNLASLIDPVNLNYVLCQINTDGHNLHLGRSPSFVVVGLALATLAHSMPL